MTSPSRSNVPPITSQTAPPPAPPSFPPPLPRSVGSVAEPYVAPPWAPPSPSPPCPPYHQPAPAASGSTIISPSTAQIRRLGGRAIRCAPLGSSVAIPTLSPVA